jgi:hypothetical protein
MNAHKLIDLLNAFVPLQLEKAISNIFLIVFPPRKQLYNHLMGYAS